MYKSYARELYIYILLNALMNVPTASEYMPVHSDISTG